MGELKKTKQRIKEIWHFRHYHDERHSIRSMLRYAKRIRDSRKAPSTP